MTHTHTHTLSLKHGSVPKLWPKASRQIPEYKHSSFSMIPVIGSECLDCKRTFADVDV